MTMTHEARAADDLRLAPLDAGDAVAFEAFTYPRLSRELRQLPDSWFAICAWIAGRPAGLALGHMESDGVADLLSLFVDRDHRCCGIGRRLVADLSRTLRERGARSISARIGGHNPSRPALDRVLTGLGWPALDCVEIRVLGHAGAMAREGGQWKGVRSLLDDDTVTYDPWIDFEEQDWQAFDALIVQSGLKRPSRHYLAMTGLEPRVSVVLRRAGRPVGWVVGRHAHAPMMDGRQVPAIGYASAFVEPALARRGVLIAGFWHAFTRQAETFGPESIAVYQTPTPRMIALSRRRFAPIALETNEVFGSILRLHP